MKLSNPEAESLLLSSLLRSLPRVAALCVEANVCRSTFTDDANGQLYTFLLGAWTEQRTIERFRMVIELRSYGMVEAVGGLDRINHLFTLPAIESAAPDYIAVILDCALRRSLLASTGAAHTDLQGETPTEEIVANIRASVDSLQSNSKIETPTAREMSDEVFRDSMGEEVLRTGFDCIDYKCGGVRRGDMLVVSGQAKAGKSTLSANIARHIANSGFVVIFTIEMNRKEYWKKMLCAAAAVPSSFFDGPGTPPDHQTQRMKACLPVMDKLPITIIDRLYDIDQAITMATMLKQKHGGMAGCVFDYLQLFYCDALKGSNTTAMVSGISAKIKRAAVALQALAIVPCQLNDDGRALDSRAAERDCNLMLKIDRDEKTGARKVQVGYNRNGPMHIPLPLEAELHFSRFVEGKNGRADA